MIKEIQRYFLKTTLQFIIDASKSEHSLSAMNFFEKNIKLSKNEKNQYEHYFNLWGATLIENINLLPLQKKQIISITFVVPESSKNGFKITGTILNFDILASKAVHFRSWDVSRHLNLI